MSQEEHRNLTWGDLTGLTWGDLTNLTWGDLTEPIDVLYERYHDSQLPLTANAAEQLEKLIPKLPEDVKPATKPENIGDSISLLKRIQESHLFQTAVDAGIVVMVTKLLDYLLEILNH